MGFRISRHILHGLLGQTGVQGTLVGAEESCGWKDCKNEDGLISVVVVVVD